jgi:hypothetical protein
MSSEPATAATELNTRASDSVAHDAALQLADALASATLDRELSRLQPLISDIHSQMALAQESQVSSSASCGQLQGEVLPQLQQRAHVMTTIFALVDKIEEHVQRVSANVSDMERALRVRGHAVHFLIGVCGIGFNRSAARGGGA